MCYLGFREEHSLAKMLPIRAVAHRPPDRGHGVRMDLTGTVYVFSNNNIHWKSKDYFSMILMYK